MTIDAGVSASQGDRAFQHNEHFFRALIENSSDVVVLLDTEGLVTYVSPSITRIMGYDAEEFVGSHALVIIHPDDLQSMQQVLGNIFTLPGKTLSAEYRMRCKDGSWRWFEASAVNLLDDPRVRAIVGNFRDITTRKRAEETLQVQRERLDLALEASQLGLWHCDLPFDKLIWNDKVKEHFGLPPDADVTIDLFYALLHPGDRERTRLVIEQSIANHSTYDIEYRTIGRLDGRTRWIRAIGRAFYDANDTPRRFDGVTLD